MADQLSREQAIARLAEIENEIARLSQPEPSDEEIQRRERLQVLREMRGGGGALSPEAEKTIGKAALRYGVPIVAGLATAPASIPVMMGAGAASAGLGEAGAQTIERVAEDKEFRPGEIAGATIRGAAPVLKGLGSTMAAAGAAGGLGGLVEGKSPLKEAGIQAGAVGFLGGLGKAAGLAGEFIQGGIQRAQNVERIGPGVEATIGQAFPEFAGLETRVASQTGSQSLRKQMVDQSQAIARAVQNIMGSPAENYPDLVKRVAQTIGNLGQETADRLKNEAQNVNDAFVAVEKARSEAQRLVAQDALAEAQKSFQQAVEVETLKGGIRGGGVRMYQSAKMGAEAEDIIQNTKKAFSDRSAELYAPVKQFENTPAFALDLPAGQGVGSVQDEILGLLNKYPVLQTGEQSRVFTPYIRKLEEILASKQPASLNDLRAIRDQLYDASDVAGQAFGTAAKRDIRNVANRITQTIDFQAPYFLGPNEALALKTANKFYSQFRPRFDDFGVVQAFKPGTMETGQMAEMMAGRTAAQGTPTPAFENPYTLLRDLQKEGVLNVPSPDKLADITRSGIVDRSIDAATGEVDLMKLAGDLNNIAQQGGGGLQQLGFGTTQELNRFVKFVQNLEPAKAKGPEAVLELLKTGTPAGFAVASRAVRTLPDLATVDTVLKTLEKQAVGGSKAAADTLIQIRAREIEDLLLKASSEGRVANLGSLTELSDPAMRDNVERIIGRNLMKQIDSTFIPGFKVIEEARTAAGMAGSTVRGAALERLGKATVQAPAQIATGNVSQGIQNMLGNVAATLGYYTVAKAFAKGAGVTGLRSRRDFLRNLEEIAKAPQPQQIELFRRLAGEESDSE
jgi:hypothetical protein